MKLIRNNTPLLHTNIYLELLSALVIFLSDVLQWSTDPFPILFFHVAVREAPLLVLTTLEVVTAAVITAVLEVRVLVW